MYSYNWLTSWKEILWVDYYLLLKYCRRQCVLLPPIWTKSLTIKILHHNARFWTCLKINCKLKEDWTIKIFRLALNVKNLVLSNGCEHVRNVIQWDYNSFFFQKLTKIAQRLGALPPDPIATGGSAPRPPSVIRLITLTFSKRLLS